MYRIFSSAGAGLFRAILPLTGHLRVVRLGAGVDDYAHRYGGRLLHLGIGQPTTTLAMRSLLPGRYFENVLVRVASCLLLTHGVPVLRAGVRVRNS